MSAARSAPATPRLDGGLLAALGYVAMAGSVSTDLYLAAFPDIAASFGVAPSQVQGTLTAFLLGSALGQFAIGTLSDAWGRRRTLIAALGLFALTGFAAAAAPAFGVLIALRFLQGLTGAAGAVLARAIVADLVEPARAVRAFSALIAAMGLGPVLASPLGAALTELGGWRAALCGLAVIGATMTAVAALVLPESLPPSRRTPAKFGSLLAGIRMLLADRRFVAAALAFALAYAGFMAYAGSSSFIVQSVFGASPLGYAATFSAGSVAFVAGAWINGRISRAGRARRILTLWQGLAAAAAVALALLAGTGMLHLGGYLPLVALFAAGVSATMANASALAGARAAAVAVGAGSALLGLAQFSLGALAAPLGGLFGADTALPATVVMAACLTASLVAGRIAGR